ncbi:MAG: hypothetical protein E7480_02880 [Ruminococcaceae bacterium]|nr:hypothetical protein [Oscillospiraceae bacterium]
MAEKSSINSLMYRGFPLVRCGNILYYGNLSDKYIIMLQVLDSKKNDDLEISGKVSVELQYTDPDLKAKDRVVKRSEKLGLYNAIDIGSIWLERALKGKI